MSASPVLVLSVANRAVRSGGVSPLSDSEQADGVSQNRFPLHRGVIAVACNVSSKTKRRKQTYLLYTSHDVLEHVASWDCREVPRRITAECCL